MPLRSTIIHPILGKTLTLGEMSKLKTLTLSMGFDDVSPQGPLLEIISSLQRGTTSHALEELTLRIISDLETVRPVAEDSLWGALDLALTRPAYSRLRCARIFIDARERYANTYYKLAIMQQMPLLLTAGILEVTVKGPKSSEVIYHDSYDDEDDSTDSDYDGDYDDYDDGEL